MSNGYYYSQAEKDEILKKISNNEYVTEEEKDIVYGPLIDISTIVDEVYEPDPEYDAKQRLSQQMLLAYYCGDSLAFDSVTVKDNISAQKKRYVEFNINSSHKAHRRFTEIIGDGDICELLAVKVKTLCATGWLNNYYEGVDNISIEINDWQHDFMLSFTINTGTESEELFMLGFYEIHELEERVS